MAISTTLFYVMTFIILFFAIAVLILPSPIYAALCLAGTMVTLGFMYMLLEAYFIAGVQLIVYAGAVVVLALLGGFLVSGLAVLIRRTLEGHTPGPEVSTDSVQPMIVQALIDGAAVGGRSFSSQRSTGLASSLGRPMDETA